MHIKVEVIVGLAIAILIISMSGAATAVCIDGYKINNCTGSGLEGWPVRVSNETTGFNTTTGPDGHYQVCDLIPGNYTVLEAQNPNWMNLTPFSVEVVLGASNQTVNFTNRPLFGTINVTKYNDQNGNGQRDPGEQGLRNWVINLTYANGTLYRSNQTPASGSYTFTNVPLGTYNISEDVKYGWTQTEPATNNYTVIVNCTKLNTTLLFGNHQNRIFGYKLDNQTGLGIANWTINLYNNGNGNFFDNATTNSSGYYEFSGVYITPTRKYRMNETLQPGYVLVSPLSGQYIIQQLNKSHLDEGPLNFTNQRQFCIKGYKIDNQTGMGQPGWNITVNDDLALEVGNATTNQDGYYQVCGLLPGNYTVSETMQPGWQGVTPTSQDVTLISDNLTVNFTNMQNEFCINGYKIDKCTGLGLEGWNITVRDILKQEVGTVNTGPDGFYQVCGLIPGNYTVCEELKAGWVNVTPTCVDVKVTDINASGINFMNTRKLCVDGYKMDEDTGLGLGLTNWNITLKDYLGQEIANTTTNQDGYYTFCDLIPGNYTVCENLQGGWVNVTPTCRDINLECDNLMVNFTNAMERFCINGHNIDNCTGLGLPNWNLTLKDDLGEEITNTTTNQDGYYTFCDLIPGKYTICEDLQDGWVNLTPLCVDLEIIDADISGINFTNTEKLCVQGFKLDETGLGLTNWNITLKDKLGQEIANTTTNQDGYYTFCDLPPGNYTVCENLQEGWVNVTPTCRDINLECDNLMVNFTNMMEKYCINGYKIDNCTGLGLPNWNITVTDESSAVVGNAVTDPNGYYQVCDLFPGNYTICEELQTGWINLTPRCVDVNLIANISNINFTNIEFLCLEGYKIDGDTGLGLPDWKFTLKDDLGQDIANTTTNQDGYYSFCGLFPGNYTVCEDLQDGWLNMTPTCQDVTLECDNRVVNYFTNAREKCIEGYKIDNCTGLGLPGCNITVIDPEFDIIVGTAITDANGYYKVCGLIPGGYTVCEELQDGWVNLTPLCMDVNLRANASNINFTNTREFCIEGYKINNQTGSGLPNWNITVKDESDTIIGYAVTDSNGYYLVCDLIPGNYTVCEDLQNGWLNITPACQDVTLGCDDLVINFTNTRVRFCIDGYKLDNCTGLGLPDWNITVTNESQTVIGVAVTDPSGHYQVCNLLPGNYTICEELKDGWVNLTPGCVDVVVTDAIISGINFTNTRESCISGYKLDQTGLGLPNWNISLKDEIGQEITNTTTDQDGYYTFCDLIPGTYTVCEDLQDGWLNVTPICQDVTLGCDNLMVNFTNTRETFCIDGYKIDNCTGLGVPNWNIMVKDESGASAGDAITKQDGYYQVCDLLPGNYTVCEELQNGWVNLTPGCMDVGITDTNLNDINFTNTRESCISGYKLDENGLGLPDWNITLKDELSMEIGTATTDQDGYYTFCDLIPGTYTVCEDLQDGWLNVTPICRDVTLGCDNLVINFTNTREKFCIDGYKIDDCTGLGLSGWNITIKDESDTVIGDAVTDASGYYQVCGLFPGNYTVCEEVKPGWVNLTPGCVDIRVTNANISDINFTNQGPGTIFGYSINNCTKLGLEGWQINLYNPSGLVATTTTDSAGYYAFVNLPLETYLVNETLMGGWTLTEPASGSYMVTIDCSDPTFENGNFTNRPLGKILGYTLDDATNLGLAGWQMNLYNGSGLVAQTITNASGFFSFTNLTFDTYIVNETPVIGYDLVAPAGGNYMVNVSCSQLPFLNANFTASPEPGMITGHKLSDPGNTGLTGWTITLVNATNSSQIYTNITDPDGNFAFTNIPWGTYYLNETPVQGWIQITPNQTLEINQTTLNIVYDFRNNQTLGSISGFKFNLTSGLGLEGWTINLYNLTNGMVVAHTTTDSTGAFSFTNLPWGTYLLNETLQPGWNGLYPAGGSYTVIIDGAHLSVNDQIFINQLIPANGSVIGWVSSHCNIGSLRVPGVKVCVAVTPEDLGTDAGWCTTTDDQGVYCIPGLPTGVPLYAMASGPGYEERPISYQVDAGRVIICGNVTCTPQIPLLRVENTTQVNWFLVRRPDATLNGFLMNQGDLPQVIWCPVTEPISLTPFL